MITRIVNVASVFVVVVAAIVVLKGVSNGKESDPAAAPSTGAVSAEFLRLAGSGNRLGPVDAPVVVILYLHYGCSFCRQFELALQDMRIRYPEHLAVVVKPFTILDISPTTELFLAAECAAEQDFFEAFHTLAMRMVDGPSGLAHWRVVADSVGVPGREEFDRCVTTAKYAEEIQRHYEEGVAFGVEVVPTSVINGRVYEGALDGLGLDSAIARAMRPAR